MSQLPSPPAATADNKTNCPTELPPAYDYLWSLHNAWLITFLILGAMSLIVLIMYVETVVFFFKNLYNWKPKDKAKWVLAVYPIFAVTKFVSLIVPRSSNVNELIATCYLAICMYQFVTMLIGHYGGAKMMAKKLDGSRFRLSTPPCCCCCVCLPYPEVTRKNIHSVQSLVIQYALLGPLLSYSMSIVWADDDIYTNSFTNPSTYMNLANTIASLVALWGMSVTFRFSAPLLARTHVKPKFFCMQLINVFHNLQSLLFQILILSDVFKCEGMLNQTAVGLRYHNAIMIVEVFVLWIIARHYYRDIGDVPIEDQVYVDTCNMATNVTGTLLKDLDVSSTRSTGTFGPTCARDIIKEESMLRALAMVQNRGSDVSFMMDTDANKEILRNRRLYLAAEVSAYEPVQYSNKGRRGGYGNGPPAKQAKTTKGNGRIKINRSNMYNASPEAATERDTERKYRKRSAPEMVSTGTGGETEYPKERHSEPIPNGRETGKMSAIPERQADDPGYGEQDDSYTTSVRGEHLPYPPRPSQQRPPQQQQTINDSEHPSSPTRTVPHSPPAWNIKPPLLDDEPLPPPQLQKSLSPKMQDLPPPPPIQSQPGRVYSPRPPSVASSVTRPPSVASSVTRPPSVASSISSRTTDRPFMMLLSTEESADDSRPPSTIPPARAARKAKRAAQKAALTDQGPSSPTGNSTFRPVQPLNQQGSQQHQAASPNEIILNIDSTV